MTDREFITMFARHRLAIRLVGLAFAVALSMVVWAGRAEAACTVPNSISNGQVADATAVMGNFNTLNDCVNSAVSPSGTPVAGNLSIFSSPNTVTSGNLSGDCTTAGTLALTCTKTNGTSFGPFATGTDAGQLTGTVSVNRFSNGTNADTSHFLRGDGVWALPPGGGGSTNAWIVNSSWDFAVNGAVSEVISGDLSPYKEVMILFQGITTSSSTWRVVQVSVDGGTSYYTTSGDYQRITTDGILTVDEAFYPHSSSSANARSGLMILSGIDISGMPKPSMNPTRGDNAAIFVASTSPINKLKLKPLSGTATFTGGKAWILVR